MKIFYFNLTGNSKLGEILGEGAQFDGGTVVLQMVGEKRITILNDICEIQHIFKGGNIKLNWLSRKQEKENKAEKDKDSHEEDFQGKLIEEYATRVAGMMEALMNACPQHARECQEYKDLEHKFLLINALKELARHSEEEK